MAKVKILSEFADQTFGGVTTDMRDVLIVSPDAPQGTRLEELAQARGLRPKSCVDHEQALEWLELRSYALLFVDARLKERTVKQLAEALWVKSPSSSCIVVDFEGAPNFDAQRVKLFGGRVIQPPDVDQKVGRIMDLVGTAAPLERNDFKILVVEDLDSPRDIICIFLESLGYPHVEGVHSAPEALRLLEEKPEDYSCIVTDIRMPEVDGKELIQVIRKSDKLLHLPIVVLTAYGTVDSLIDCLKAGASGFLVKPPKKKDLQRELSRAMRVKLGHENPRLATHEEAEYVRQLIEEGQLSS